MARATSGAEVRRRRHIPNKNPTSVPWRSLLVSVRMRLSPSTLRRHGHCSVTDRENRRQRINEEGGDAHLWQSEIFESRWRLEMTSAARSRKPVEEAEGNQRSDQVEPMHRGAKAEADDYSDGRRQTDSERGVAGSDQPLPGTGGTTGEHSGQEAIPPLQPKK